LKEDKEENIPIITDRLELPKVTENNPLPISESSENDKLESNLIVTKPLELPKLPENNTLSG